MANYVTRLFEANQVSKEACKVEEVATAAKRTAAAHAVMSGFFMGPKEYILIAETNTLGGSKNHDKFLEHL